MAHHRWWLLFWMLLFVVSASVAVYLNLQNRSIKDARNADDLVNVANSNRQPISFWVYQGEKYQTCSANTGTAHPLDQAASATPAPQPIATPPLHDAIPRSVTVGDVLQVTIVFNCAFNDISAVSEMRDNRVEFKPAISALDFDVAPVMANELTGRDFYCVSAPSDSVCANGTTTPVQDLKWTWFLRPRSTGHHFVRIDIYQRRIVGPGQYVEIAPRWVREYSVDVREPFTGEVALWSPVVAVIAAVIPIITFIQKRIERSRKDAQHEP